MFHDYLQHFVSLGFFCSLCVALCSVSITLFLSVEPCLLSVGVHNPHTLCSVDLLGSLVRSEIVALAPTSVVVSAGLRNVVGFDVVPGVELLAIDLVQFFVSVHHSYYLLYSWVVFPSLLYLLYHIMYCLSIVFLFIFLFIYSFFLLSEHLYDLTVTSLHSHAIDGDVLMDTTRSTHGVFISDQMPVSTDLLCFSTSSKVVSCVSAHCVVLLLVCCLSLLCICIITHSREFVNSQIAQINKYFIIDKIVSIGVATGVSAGDGHCCVREPWTVSTG